MGITKPEGMARWLGVAALAGVLFVAVAVATDNVGVRGCTMDGLYVEGLPDDWHLGRDFDNGCQWTIFINGDRAGDASYDQIGLDRPTAFTAGPLHVAGVVVSVVALFGILLLIAPRARPPT